MTCAGKNFDLVNKHKLSLRRSLRSEEACTYTFLNPSKLGNSSVWTATKKARPKDLAVLALKLISWK